jgi:hypothetical protein
MDELITAGARALASGDVLGALNYVAFHDDPPALALRGIAMAQLGELPRARLLLRREARALGNKQAAARARCLIAEAERLLPTREPIEGKGRERGRCSSYRDVIGNTGTVAY